MGLIWATSSLTPNSAGRTCQTAFAESRGDFELLLMTLRSNHLLHFALSRSFLSSPPLSVALTLTLLLGRTSAARCHPQGLLIGKYDKHGVAQKRSRFIFQFLWNEPTLRESGDWSHGIARQWKDRFLSLTFCLSLARPTEPKSASSGDAEEDSERQTHDSSIHPQPREFFVRNPSGNTCASNMQACCQTHLYLDQTRKKIVISFINNVNSLRDPWILKYIKEKYFRLILVDKVKQ